jgi:hypothetical protein
VGPFGFEFRGAVAPTCFLLLASCAQAPNAPHSESAASPIRAPSFTPDMGFGQVAIAGVIETNGQIDHCAVTANTGHPALAATALEWLCGPDGPRYRPAIKGGKPVSVSHTWTFTYQHPTPPSEF